MTDIHTCEHEPSSELACIERHDDGPWLLALYDELVYDGGNRHVEVSAEIRFCPFCGERLPTTGLLFVPEGGDFKDPGFDDSVMGVPLEKKPR